MNELGTKLLDLFIKNITENILPAAHAGSEKENGFITRSAVAWSKLSTVSAYSSTGLVER